MRALVVLVLMSASVAWAQGSAVGPSSTGSDRPDLERALKTYFRGERTAGLAAFSVSGVSALTAGS
ncbi:MAG TPA: hypothetical protein VGE37_16355, partial [Archangium sp.]